MICGNLCHPFWNGSQHPSWAKFGPILGKQEPRVRPAISGRISVGGYGRLWPVTKKAKGTGPSFHLWWLHGALALILSHCRSLGLTPWVWEMLLGLREHSLSKGKRRGCVCVCSRRPWWAITKAATRGTLSGWPSLLWTPNSTLKSDTGSKQKCLKPPQTPLSLWFTVHMINTYWHTIQIYWHTYIHKHPTHTNLFCHSTGGCWGWFLSVKAAWLRLCPQFSV